MRLDAFVGPRWSIDDYHFIGAVDEVLRHCVALGAAEETAHELLLLGDELEIDRGEHRNSGFEQFLDMRRLP